MGEFIIKDIVSGRFATLTGGYSTEYPDAVVIGCGETAARMAGKMAFGTGHPHEVIENYGMANEDQVAIT